MAEAHATLKLVYLSLRETLVGDAALIRKKKAVKNIIEQHKQEPQIHSLLQRGHSIEKIANLAHALLLEQIFESTAKAKARFPELFEVSESSTAAPAMRESQVTPGGVVAAESVAPKPTGENKSDGLDSADIQITKADSPPPIRPQSPRPTTSPDPIPLPFWYQHRIMVRIQTLLEKVCFNFALRHLNDILQENAWDCAEAIELNQWPKILVKHQDKLGQVNPQDTEKVLPELLTSINQIRHAAVHRLRLPGRSVLSLITDAEAFAKLLQDDGGLAMISTIRQQVSSSIEDLEQSRDLLESRLAAIKKEFEEKRARLAREEAALVEAAKEESRENDFFAHADPEDTLDALIAAKARWGQKSSVAASVDEACESSGTDGPDLGNEAVYASPSFEEPNGRPTPLDAESDDIAGDPNAYFTDDLAITAPLCATTSEHAEKPHAVAVLNPLQTHTAGSLSKLNTSLPSPPASECEYWATPWDSRSPTEVAPGVDGGEDPGAISG